MLKILETAFLKHQISIHCYNPKLISKESSKCLYSTEFLQPLRWYRIKKETSDRAEIWPVGISKQNKF